MKNALVIAAIFTLSIVSAPSSTRAQSASARSGREAARQAVLDGQTAVRSAPADKPTVKRTVLLQHALPIAGYDAVLVQGDMPAGSREGRHTHPGTAIGRVEEGVMTLEQDGKPTTTYKAGESFLIEAGQVHEGMNKGTVPVRTTVTFVVQKGKPLTTQVGPATK